MIDVRDRRWREDHCVVYPFRDYAIDMDALLGLALNYRGIEAHFTGWCDG
jgi:hypothetical protein